MDEQQLRNALCLAAQQLWMRGLVVADEGLVSAALHRRRYLVTPPGIRRAELKPNDLPCVDLAGETVHGHARIDPASWRPHRSAYQIEGRQIGATILVSPASTTALLHLCPEAAELRLPGLGPVTTIDPNENGAISQAMTGAAAVVLRGVGVLSAGPDLAAALNAIERVERAASIQLTLHRHG